MLEPAESAGDFRVEDPARRTWSDGPRCSGRPTSSRVQPQPGEAGEVRARRVDDPLLAADHRLEGSGELAAVALGINEEGAGSSATDSDEECAVVVAVPGGAFCVDGDGPAAGSKPLSGGGERFGGVRELRKTFPWCGQRGRVGEGIGDPAGGTPRNVSSGVGLGETAQRCAFAERFDLGCLVFPRVRSHGCRLTGG